jgi:hypothetical protein
MSNRFAYEKLTLASRRLAGPLALAELASLPAYDGFEAQHDTCYDGSVILVAIEFGVLCSGQLTVEILGPFWDRIFRIEFSQVAQVRLSRPALHGMDVKSIEVKSGEAGSIVCTVHSLPFADFIEVECETVSVFRFLLTEPLKR